MTVIMVKRDEIIADWQSRLETAAGHEGLSSPRAAWLARVRWRLYRFLLSLYGDGHWNAPAAPEAQSAAVKTSSPTSQAAFADAVLLTGKPAKSGTEIGAVLKAVAGARLEPAPVGPLLAGQGDDAWLPIASASCDFDPEQCVAALLAAKVYARVIPRQGDCIVEVRAREFATAQRVLYSEMHRLRVPRRSIEQARPEAPERIFQFISALIRQVPPLWRFIFIAAFELALTFPAALFAVTLVSFMHFGPEPKSLALDQGFFEHFWSVWRGLFITTMLIIVAQYQNRARRNARVPDANGPGD
jgi:hypothetical protein